jgi:PAS domain S-box-containing protein
MHHEGYDVGAQFKSTPRNGTRTATLPSGLGPPDVQLPPKLSQESEEQIAEARREHNAALLSAIVETSDAAIATSGTAQRFTSWNQGAERIFGYAAIEAIGLPIALLAPPELKAQFDELLTWLQRGGQLRDFATRGLRKDGSAVEIQLTAAPMTNAKGDRLGLSFIVRDISAECDARRRLEETEEWLRQTLAHAPLLVTATDAEGIYTMVEGQARTALGLGNGDALLGRSALASTGEDSPAGSTTRKALAGETTTAMAAINGHSFEMWKAPLRNPQGRIIGTLSVNTDVSQRVAIEQELMARRRQQETIAALSKNALGGAPFEDLARRTAGRAREALNVELAGMFMQKAANAGFKARAVAAGASPGIEMGALSFPPTASLAAFAVEAGVPIISEDLPGETRFTPHPELLRAGFASAMAVAFGPLKGNWGVLAAYSRLPRRFTSDDAHFIQAIANILTSAIANAEADQKLQRSEAYFRSLIEHTSDVITVIDRRGIIRFMAGRSRPCLATRRSRRSVNPRSACLRRRGGRRSQRRRSTPSGTPAK